MEQAREAAQVVSEFFQGNPFGTHVGKMIGEFFYLYIFILSPTYLMQFPKLFITEQATDSSLETENWALNMDICDAINSLQDGCDWLGLPTVHYVGRYDVFQN